jgi:hypothetical protein
MLLAPLLRLVTRSDAAVLPRMSRGRVIQFSYAVRRARAARELR